VAYHPQKREGFGFTDGEGCERIWASIKKLIPGLRVSGVSVPLITMAHFYSEKSQYHRRLYLLDCQLAHLNQAQLLQQGRWWKKKRESLEKKKNTAKEEIKNCTVTLLGLRLQWKQQQYDCTKKPPSMMYIYPFVCLLVS
jgi:hypothetical protein